MNRNESDERDLQQLFEEAREADGAQAPAFHAVIERGRASAAPRLRRLGVRVSFGTAGMVAALAVLALLLPKALEQGPLRDESSRAAPPASPPPQAALSASPAAQPASTSPTPRSADDRSHPLPVGTSERVNEKVVPEKDNLEGADRTSSIEPLQALGYVGDATAGSAGAGVPKAETVETADTKTARRFYQNALMLAPGVQEADKSEVHVARSRDFKAIVSGVANVDSLEGQSLALDTESYAPIQENRFLTVRENPLSTFSVDVDTASYSNVRRFLKAGRLPPRDAVRIEEMLNYFHYDDPAPTGRAPLGAAIEVAECPWEPAHRLARIAVRGREVARGEGAGSNLVFLVDVSGSMDDPAKLPLLRSALDLLVGELDGRDRVAIVVYAGASGLVLPSTSGADKAAIREALDRLQAGGSTNGGEGLRLAYKVAREGFIAGGVNRVILATDGDFNVGVTSQGELLRLIESDAKRGIFLTALGFGVGNYKDSTLEHLADRGNGNYAYIDDLREARKVLVEEIGGTLVTIAKDVKIQVEFNPAVVEAYRLIGYENRLLAKEDFNDDRKDAGEVGSGHTVTVLYELVPAGAEAPEVVPVDPLRYQSAAVPAEAAASGELMTLKIRYKDPEEDGSRLLEFPVRDGGRGLRAASPDLKFATAVAEFGMFLRDAEGFSPERLDRVRRLAAEGARHDEGGYRAEFLDLIDRAMRLQPRD